MRAVSAHSSLLYRCAQLLGRHSQAPPSSSRAALPSAGAGPWEGRIARRWQSGRPEAARGHLSLSLDEALYLAKEAGYWTTREVQLQIVRSPPFSPRERPFMLEDFFEVADADDPDDEVDAEAGDEAAEGEAEGGAPGRQSHPADPAIHGAIRRHFRPSQPTSFWHNAEEWLVRAEGRGTRKRASAHVVLSRGTGIVKVNGESDLFARWPHLYNRFDVCQPFKLTGTAGVYDTFVEVQGGGLSGQAGATRLAVARALLAANPGCHDALQRGFCLLEDTRQKMSKMPGRASSRGSFSWTKR
mmetsp:Transcript_131054/g.407587  ORF Transcript_131054/g.407587 Transcript_131054/m.407587 type:complete len:300 (+) Transcript_131054:65-964(+)